VSTSYIPPDYETLSMRLKLLAHPERLRILDALRREPECVCHLESVLGKPQPYVSQQLRLLREGGLITDEKEGINVFYRLANDEVVEWLAALLGPIQEPDTVRHRKVDGCNCPKCDPAGQRIAIALIESLDQQPAQHHAARMP
jgi:DNA-binding transcriptional ArsR family regulator